jgi:branched-chain amino acid transport system permease protein
MDIIYVLQIAVSGLTQGCLYALVALALVVIFNASGVLNFAEGAMGMAGAYVAWMLFANYGASYHLAFLAALVLSFALGVAVQLFLLGRMRGASPMMQIVATLGLFMFLEGMFGLFFGYNPQLLPQPTSLSPLVIGDLVVTPGTILGLAILAGVGGALALLFKRTQFGLAMRAITQNEYAARLMGLRVGRTLAITWGLGVLLGAAAAILAAPLTSLTPNMMDTIVVYAFAAAIIGGFGSLIGAVAGGLFLGVVNNLIVAFLAPEFSMSFIFLLLLLVLYAKPNGFFGQRTVQRV